MIVQEHRAKKRRISAVESVLLGCLLEETPALIPGLLLSGAIVVASVILHRLWRVVNICNLKESQLQLPGVLTFRASIVGQT